jgi:leucyl/phenylalanyl-tRNA--protein transferase
VSDVVRDLVGVGGDLKPETLLGAYQQGLFPMPVDGQLGWWSPDPRAILPLDGLRVTRSLRRSMRRYEIRVNTAFDAVIAACGDPARPDGWISDEINAAYRHLHELGWAHSVEAWSPDGLAGGLYGIAIGGLFAGESMFHRERDASKVALVGLVDVLTADGDAEHRLLDVQWRTEHLGTLGTIEVSRRAYLRRLATALGLPPPSGFASGENRP